MRLEALGRIDGIGAPIVLRIIHLRLAGVSGPVFSTSRISSSSTSERVGAGGALGAAASRRIKRAAALPTQNTTKAMITKLMRALMNKPTFTERNQHRPIVLFAGSEYRLASVPSYLKCWPATNYV